MSTFAEKFKRFLSCYNRLPRAVDLLLVAILIGAVCYYNYDWIQSNVKPPVSDAAAHAYQSIHFHRILTETRVDRAIFQFFTFRHHYPLLSYQVNEAFFFVLGLNKQVTSIGIFPFVALLGFSMYYLGSMLGGRIGGLCAAVITCTSPLALELSREPFVDYQLCAATAFGIAAVFACQGFSNKKSSIICGLALAVGMSTKWTFFLFIAIPLLVACISACIHTDKEGWRYAWRLLFLNIAIVGGLYASLAQDLTLSAYTGERWINLLEAFGVLVVAFFVGRRWCWAKVASPLYNMMLAATVGLTLITPWYCTNWDQIYYKMTYQANVAVSYWSVLQNNILTQNTWIYCIVILLGCGLLTGICRRETRSMVCQLILVWALNVAVLSNAPFDQRYIFPLIVPLAGVAVCSFAWFKIFGLLPLLAFAGIGALQMSYHTLDNPPEWYTMKEMHQSRVPVILPLPCHAKLPLDGSFPYESFCASLQRVHADLDPTWVCLFLGASRTESNVIQPRSFTYYGALCGLNLNLYEPLVENIRHGMTADELMHSNYAIMYQDPSSNLYVPERIYEPGHPTTREELIAAMQKAVPSFPRHPVTRTIFLFGQDTLVELFYGPDQKIEKGMPATDKDKILSPSDINVYQ